MKRIERSVEIAASPERVWSILTDFPAYASWNPFIRKAAGEARKGARLAVTMQPPNQRATSFKPVVLAAEPGRELRWIGHLIVPGIFDGEHTFRIEPLDASRVRLTQSETFTGVLVPFFGGLLADSARGFEQLNEALKQRAEQR